MKNFKVYKYVEALLVYGVVQQYYSSNVFWSASFFTCESSTKKCSIAILEQ